MRSLSLRVPFALLFVLSVFYEAAFASVLAIDYGSDWIKASLMKPGVPFDVLLNKDSKRKIQSSVGWKKSDRLFGSDAYNIAGRFPTDSFSSLKYLLGHPYDSEPVSYFAKISSADAVPNSDGRTMLRRSDGVEWGVHELLAMQFGYIKSLAEDLAGETVLDTILTVPPFYNQFERDHIVDALELAGLRILALINDGTGIAVNYAMTRTFAQPEYHVVYDAGASSVRATVVQFAPEGDAGKKSKSKVGGTQITVAGVGYDPGVGGTELDRRLRELLVDEFNAKHKRDISADKRGMAKLWKEAGRVKAILSANMDAVATVESAAWDIDFKAKVTRTRFEERCKDLSGRWAKPITDALRVAGLTLDNITSVILAGGASRTPMVQTAVRTAVGDDKIAMNVNADEAAVLGAGLHGAALSKQFKTKDIRVQDIYIHDVQAAYPASAASGKGGTSARTISSVIFPTGSKTGTKKTMTFKGAEDFVVKLQYKNAASPALNVDILQASISGVKEAFANLTERGAVPGDIVVKATVALSESGFVSIRDVHAFAEIKDDSLTGKLKGFFAGASSSEEATAEPDTSTESASAAETASPAAEPSATPAAEKKPTLKDGNTIPLTTKIENLTIPPLSTLQKRVSKDKLHMVDFDESNKRRKEEARNNLEGYLYRVRDLLEDDGDSPFRKCSQDKERKELSERVGDAIMWLHDKGDLAETSQFWDKKNEVESLERPIVHRYQHIEQFPAALNNSQMWNWSTRLFLTEAYENITAEAEAGLPSKWTRTELEGLEKTLREHEAWLHVEVEKQKVVKTNEDPVIEIAEMKARAKTLEMHLQRLVKRKVPKTVKTKTAAAAEETETAATATEGAAETTATSKVRPEETHDEL